ncbi:MAG: hypothetical protein JWM74_2754 [Myxococcaceae bacterium]|jgi:hypothetical protein|nr:hypothetical protein [Myxococcaceae bacterium]
MPRYLYGDSAPSPLHFNFLATLELFVVAASRAVALEREAKDIDDAARRVVLERARAIDSLERYHRSVMHSLRDSSSRHLDAFSHEYARTLSETAVRFVDATNAGIVSENEREQQRARSDSDRRRLDVRALVESFFQHATLPAIDARFSLALSEGREPKNELGAILTYPGQIVCGYALSTTAVEEWRHPRKVSEFASGIDLMVGARRSWFKKTAERDVVHLDDLYIGGFILGDDAAEIRLRRRPEQKDALFVKIQRVDTDLVAHVQVAHNESDPEGPQSSAIDGQDRVHVERLWQLLRSRVAAMLAHRDRVTGVHLDFEDVFEKNLVVTLLERVVDIMAPTVHEIARRSPNPRELSLKVESDLGQREEIYVKKEDLVRKLEVLALEERRLFAPLALGQAEFFLPGVIVAPE